MRARRINEEDWRNILPPGVTTSNEPENLVTADDLRIWEEEHEEDVLADGPYYIPDELEDELVNKIEERIESEFNITFPEYNKEDTFNYEWHERIILPLERFNLDMEDVQWIMMECFADIINKYAK